MTSKSVLAVGTLATACLATLAVGCSASSRPVAEPRTVIVRGVALAEPQVSPARYGAADLAFGLAVLDRWCAQEPQANIVLSPASLASGLGMTYLGAGGSTATAMARVMHLPPVSPALEAGLQSRMAGIHAVNGRGVTLTDADQLWTDPSLTTRSSFLNAIATGYGAGVGRVPLLTDPGKAASQINAAIAAATRGHITHLVSARSLSQIGWLLTDAIYLHARWASPFESSATYRARFTTASGRPVRAEYLSGGLFASASAGGWTAVSLPYQGGRLTMLAMLPAVANGAGPGGCQQPAPGALAALRTRLAASRARTGVALPKVSLSSSADLIGLLRRLGMGVAFGPEANFLGISPQAGSIGLIKQAATFRVDEQGTVATAATAVGVLPTAAEAAHHIVVFNRPYLMLVLDTSTGEPLFLARVANPDLH